MLKLRKRLNFGIEGFAKWAVVIIILATFAWASQSSRVPDAFSGLAPQEESE